MQVASVSANCDPEIGDLIVRAFEKVGKDGVITVSVSVSIFFLCSVWPYGLILYAQLISNLIY